MTHKVTLTLWNKDGSVVMRQTGRWGSVERAEKEIAYIRKTNTMFGGIEGKTFTIDLNGTRLTQNA